MKDFFGSHASGGLLEGANLGPSDPRDPNSPPLRDELISLQPDMPLVSSKLLLNIYAAANHLFKGGVVKLDDRMKQYFEKYLLEGGWLKPGEDSIDEARYILFALPPPKFQTYGSPSHCVVRKRLCTTQWLGQQEILAYHPNIVSQLNDEDRLILRVFGTWMSIYTV